MRGFLFIHNLACHDLIASAISGSFKEGQPVLMGDFCDERFTKRTFTHPFNQSLITRQEPILLGTVVPSKSEPSPTPSSPQLFNQISEVVDHDVQLHIDLGFVSVRAQEPDRIIQPHETLALFNCRQLLVGQVSARTTKSVNVGVGSRASAYQ